MSEIYDFLRDTEKREIRTGNTARKFNISIDAGSSETRSHVWNGNPRAGAVYGIDSAYSVVTSDISSVASQSNALYDNMEIVLMDNTKAKKDKVFTDITIVKGGLFEDLRLPSVKTSSNTGKGQQETTYINAIVNAGLRAYGIAHSDGIAADKYVVSLSLALPQEDIISSKRQEEIKSKLAGEYWFCMERMDFSTTIVIPTEEIFLFDEAQATIGYWSFNNKDIAKNYQGIMVADAGGRSVDLSVMLNGRIISKGSQTCKMGGQKFVDIIAERYVNVTGNNMPNREMILAALDTGKLQNGNQSVDITQFIEDAKKELVPSIVSDINSLLDKNDLSMAQINLVLCSGRLMRETDNESRHVPSLAEFLGKEVAKMSPGTMVGMVSDEYSLVKGLSLARFAFDAKKAKGLA